MTAEDIPGENKIGHLKHDQYTLIPVGGLVHYLGDAIALVAAKDRETAEKAVKLIKVEYEVLPHVHTTAQAAAPMHQRFLTKKKTISVHINTSAEEMQRKRSEMQGM